jgi:PPE-repeat protein
VVPPQAIAANRIQWAALLVTNVFGQNAPAIAANEARYAEMWAQDVMVMSQYSATSQASTSAILPFVGAPVTSTAAVAATSPSTTTPTNIAKAALTRSDFVGTQSLPDLSNAYLESLIGSGSPINLLTMLATFNGYSALAEATRENRPMFPTPGLPDDSAGSVVLPNPKGLVPVSASSGTPPVSASTGTASRTGSLSVPPSWTQQQSIPPAATPLQNIPRGNRPKFPIGWPAIPAVPVIAAGTRKGKKGSDPDDFDYGRPIPPVVARHPSGG